MNLLKKIKSRLYSPAIKETEVAKAYDLWANNYDSQPDNLILVLDEKLFSSMLNKVNINGKVVADIGCGTGRHWEKILDKHPLNLYGFDVSAGMLERLQKKYPLADVRQLTTNILPDIECESCDVIVSTLAVAHIENIEDALNEWNRVLKNDGDLIITDYHPKNLTMGGQRTFAYEGKIIAVKNHIHPIEELKSVFNKLQLTILHFEEMVIDESMKHFYKKQNALHVYEKYKGCPIIYGMHLRKTNAIT
jgi:ubiquinone/menaquinone biosynthesis C-methylase UbiE